MKVISTILRATGTKVSTDASLLFRQSSQRLLQEVRSLEFSLSHNDKSIVSQANKAVDLFPSEPIFRYYQVCALIDNKDIGKTEQMLHEALRLFPDDLLINLVRIEHLLEIGDKKTALQLLRQAKHLHEYELSRDTFHVFEYAAFHNIAGKVYAAHLNHDTAKHHLRCLISWDDDNFKTRDLALKIVMARSPFFNRHQYPQVVALKPNIYPQTTQPPSFQHEIIGSLMNVPWKAISQEKVDEISALPRDTVIQDLETLLIDSIQRLDFYLDHEDMMLTSASHAMSMLALLKAESALPVVLNTIRQTDQYFELWFGDSTNDFYVWYLTSIMSEKHLKTFHEITCEPNRYTYSIYCIHATICQWGLKNPENRALAIQWFADQFQYYLDHGDDTQFIDATTITFAICEASNFRAPELIPYIIDIDKKGWLDINVMGNVDEIIREINLPADPHDIYAFPENITEFNDDSYEKRRAKSNKIIDFESLLDPTDPAEIYLRNLHSELMSIATEKLAEINNPKPAAAPAIKTEYNVSKNAPCPCGSGLKYKRCHGKNA